MFLAKALHSINFREWSSFNAEIAMTIYLCPNLPYSYIHIHFAKIADD